MNAYKELKVWQKSMVLTEYIYVITKSLPEVERYGLISQMQRAAVGISSNIAEGAKRSYEKEFIQFLSIANGSAAELETQLIIAQKIYGNSADFKNALDLVEEVLKMLHSLITSLRTRPTVY